MTRLNEYYTWVAQRGCIVPGCDRKPSLHHVNGTRSFKTGHRLRKRQHLAEYAVLPVCPMHHQDAPDSIHATSEEVFGVNYLGGSTAVLEWAFTLALRFIQEKR